MVAADLRRRGYKIAVPYGEDWDFDLIVCRKGKFERLQVKSSVTVSGALRLALPANGKVSGQSATRPGIRARRGPLRAVITAQPRARPNNQRQGIRNAIDYVDI